MTVSMHRKYAITTNFLDTMLEHSVEIQDGESKLDAYRRGLIELDQIAADLRKEAESMRGTIIQETLNGVVPHDIRQTRVIPTISKDKEPEDRRIGIVIADIYSCESIKVLESYKLLAKAKPELQAAYDQQYNKLKGLHV